MTDHYRSQSQPFRTDQQLKEVDQQESGNNGSSLSFTRSSSSIGTSPLSSGGSGSMTYSAASRVFSDFASPDSASSMLPSYETSASQFSSPASRDVRQLPTLSRASDHPSRPSTSGDAAQGNSHNVGNDNGAGPSKRNFLVPISGTGARQKLSILSASQRPRTAQAATPTNFFASSSTATKRQGPGPSLSSTSATSYAPEVKGKAEGYESSTFSNEQNGRNQQNSPLSSFSEKHASPASSQRRPSTADLSQRPSRSNSASGAMDTAGFSPQLASVLAGQSMGIPFSNSALDAHTRRDPPVSASPFGHETAPTDKVRSTSHTQARAEPIVQPKRSFSDLRPFGTGASAGNEATLPTTNGKDKTGSLKSGLRSMFSRSANGKGLGRPSTAHSVSTTHISAPQLQSASAMATPPSTSARTMSQSNSGQSFASRSSSDNILSSNDGRSALMQHHRKLSGQSAQPQGPTVSHPYRSLSRTSGLNEYSASPEPSATPPRHIKHISSEDNFTPPGGPGSESSKYAASPDSERANGVYNTPTKNFQVYGRRPSRGEASRPLTAPAPADAFYSPEKPEIDSRARARTPVLSTQTSSNTLTPSPSKRQGQQSGSENDGGGTARDGDATALERQASSQSISRIYNQSKDLPADPRQAVYSAPNSSRSLSPADPSKPTVPLTSPLLASIMGRGTNSNGSLASLSLERDSSGSESAAAATTSTNVAQSKAQTHAESLVSPSRSVTTLSEADQRPALPAKSRSRQTIDADAEPNEPNESVARAFMADAAPKGDPLVSGVQNSTNKDSAQTYVPPDALKQTRKGTTVAFNPRATESDATAVEADMSTPKAGRSVPLPSVHGVSPSSSRGAGKAAGIDAQLSSFGSTDLDEGESSFDTVNLLPDSAWVEVEVALDRYKGGDLQIQSASEKGVQLRTVLLPFLALEAETPETQVSGNGKYRLGKARRQLFFDWIRQLLFELQSIQTSADRGAILESIACIIESRNLSAIAFEGDPDDEKTFFGVLGHILNYAIGELNKKGVYQNTLIFSGRLLAVAFFRIEGVASKLLRALPVNRFALERVANEAKWHQSPSSAEWEAFKGIFPPWLRAFCFEDARSYLKMLDSQSGQGEDDDDRYLVRQDGVEVEMSGNWLRRWQSDDSELFFSFCRNYHRQSASTILAMRPASNVNASNEKKLFFGGPGFAHLATCIHQKCLSLVHRDILSVTTLSSQKNFNPGETANVLSGSTAGKPRHLEAANRRCTAIIVDIVRASPGVVSHVSLFAPMLDMHIKCLVKRTSLYDVQGVFCLLDWLDGVLGHMESAEIVICDHVDIDFLLQTIWLLLKDADHALALMRTIAFCYSNFAILTATTTHRQRFFEEILLNPRIFSKLFLSWSFTIRAYFLHLLVFRLARINDFSNPDDDPDGKTSLRIVKLFSKRLDEIRKRHDELSPQPSSADSQSDDDEAPNKRRPQSFVSTIRRTPSVHQVELSPAMTKAERVLGIGLPDPVLAVKPENKAQSRAAKWLRVLGGKAGGAKGKAGSVTTSGGKTSTDQSIDSSMSRATTVDDISGSSIAEDAMGGRNRLPKVDESDVYSVGGVSDYPTSDDGGNVTPKMENFGGELDYNFERKAPPVEVDPLSVDNSLALHSSTVGAADNAQNVSGNEHISPDMSFDLQNASSTGNTIGEAGSTQPSRISRAFSRRQSLLPGPALSLVHGETESGGAMIDEQQTVDENLTNVGAEKDENEDDAAPYDRTLHIYAVQSLREYEQTVQEHDDFFSAQQDSSSPQVPRLPIQWPAMWSE